jgi:putative acetyltransferase
MRIRKEQPADVGDIRRVNELAFGRPQEAGLVDVLRSNGGLTLSMVAVDDDKVVGHIAFSPVMVESNDESFAAVGLGPMAVLPESQGRGIGSALVRAGLTSLRESRHLVVVVLGHPSYYPRFGFRRASEYGIRWQKGPADEAFMVLELAPQALSGKHGAVSYRPEFDDV